MSFQKRHYQSVADVINDAMENMDQPMAHNHDHLVGKVAGIEEVANSLADMFAHDNESFSRSTFMAACGLTPS